MDQGQRVGFVSAVKYDKMNPESLSASESPSHTDVPGRDPATQAGGESDGTCWTVKAGGGLRTAAPICSLSGDLGSLQGWILRLPELTTAWGPTTGTSSSPSALLAAILRGENTKVWKERGFGGARSLNTSTQNGARGPRRSPGRGCFELSLLSLPL